MDEITTADLTDVSDEGALMSDGLIDAQQDAALDNYTDDSTALETDVTENGNIATVTEDSEDVDYERLMADDLQALKGEFPELSSIDSITELENPLRYAALRDLGLSPSEAYLATAKRAKRDNRSHLTSAYGKSATPPGGIMSQRELREAREVLGDLSDLEIRSLYKRVKERS